MRHLDVLLVSGLVIFNATFVFVVLQLSYVQGDVVIYSVVATKQSVE